MKIVRDGIEIELTKSERYEAWCEYERDCTVPVLWESPWMRSKRESYWFYCEDFDTAEYLATLVKQDGGELVGDILYDFGSSLYGSEFFKENTK